MTELITPITRGDVEFLAPCHRRHPRDGVLITQLVRPLVRALYGVALDEPLGAEFSCSGRFASHCLEQDIWDHEVARFAIDLWLRTEAVAEGFAVGQIWRPATTAAGARTKLREAVQQVVLALIESLRAHDSFWKATNGVVELPHVGDRSEGSARRATPGITRRWPSRPVTTSARSARCSRRCSRRTLSRRHRRGDLVPDLAPRRRALGQDCLRVRRGHAAGTGRHRAPGWACSFRSTCGARRHSWRMRRIEADATVQAGLDSLCQTFQRLKPVLVSSWSAEV